MATLTIRNLPDPVRDRLRVRASKAGRSMEAEAREILARSVLSVHGVSGAEDLQRLVQRLYGGASPRASSRDLIRDRRREAIAEMIEAGEDPKLVLRENFRAVCREAGMTVADVQRMVKARASSRE